MKKLFYINLSSNPRVISDNKLNDDFDVLGLLNQDVVIAYCLTKDYKYSILDYPNKPQIAPKDLQVCKSV